MRKWIVGIIVLIIAIGILTNAGGNKEIPRESSSEDSQVEQNNTDVPTLNKEDEFYSVGGYGVKINEVKVVEDSLSKTGKSAIIVYKFRNDNEEPQSFNWAFSDHVYQDGVELINPELSYVDGFSSYDYTGSTNIKGGATLEVTEAYRLIDETADIEIVVGNSMMNLAGVEPLTQKISIIE